MKALIVTNVDCGKGLACDARIFAAQLAANGWTSETVDYRWAAASGRADLGIACEVVPRPVHFDMATRWWLMVNPEWAIPATVETVPRFERVLCRTTHASQVHPWWGKGVVTGFESEDIAPAEFVAPVEFLHSAGGSISRGTLPLLEAWRIARSRGMRDALLNIVNAPDIPGIRDALQRTSNVNRHERLATDRFRALQRRCYVHVQPSESEGWGHLFWEAMSLGAHVIATDAPWWSEAEGAYCAVPAVAGDVPRHLCPRLAVDVAALATALVDAAGMASTPNRKARDRFEFLRADWRERFATLLESVPQ